MLQVAQALNKLYKDAPGCAELVGLKYVEPEEAGLTRIKHGTGFQYLTIQHKPVQNKTIKERIAKLVIPPAWKNVWIAGSAKNHVLATGFDERGRKQYIYHPKWRRTRDLIKFYRMIVFGAALPKIRQDINKNLALRKLGYEKVIATMLWILDNAYIRVGNDVYYQQNESIGLTTLTDRNVMIAGPVVTLSFMGKSGKDHQITFEHSGIAKTLNELKQIKGARLFRYEDAAGDWHDITAEDINKYLHELTGAQISAKDFRTWGGTLMAFLHLLDEDAASRKKPEKVIVEAVDTAAAVLGNTRSVARSSYVHPDLLGVYGSKKFNKYITKARKARKVAGLDDAESDLTHFLEALFEEEFTLLRKD